jgi:clan AA aspartic protease (TIGR02281 family)
VLLVPVQIDALDLEFLVDTGAAYTAISPDVATLFNLSLSLQRQLRIVLAQGAPLSVPQVSLPELFIGRMRLRQVEALVMTFPSALKLDGVIGMNVLRQFRVTLESDTSTLVLRAV